jgi:hypothetical protein
VALGVQHLASRKIGIAWNRAQLQGGKLPQASFDELLMMG